MLYTSRYTHRHSNAISDGYKFQPNILIPVFFNGLTEIFLKFKSKEYFCEWKEYNVCFDSESVIVNKKKHCCVSVIY